MGTGITDRCGQGEVQVLWEDMVIARELETARGVSPEEGKHLN